MNHLGIIGCVKPLVILRHKRYKPILNEYIAVASAISIAMPNAQ
jgi:hypothetical protein